MRAEERQAIARLKRGDIGRLEPLVRRYQLPALRAATLITRDRALAEDIVQAAFLRAYERIGQFDPGRPFGPWFLRVVVNDAAKAAARRQRQQSLDEPEADGTAIAERLAASEGDPLALLERAETEREISAALAYLPVAQRAAIVQRYYLDLSEARRDGRRVGPAARHGEVAPAWGTARAGCAVVLLVRLAGPLDRNGASRCARAGG